MCKSKTDQLPNPVSFLYMTTTRGPPKLEDILIAVWIRNSQLIILNLKNILILCINLEFYHLKD